ncbi:RNA-binding protein 42 [Pleurostoma richardsiae]|uniref:RNA-binding protein 42 n=1 Tax=Pleurostoma richardsiae TaxID=41990 RepID=A0AA38S6S0_9PEZI|nr:RNA-binding protein 42 [Pleurostoma richardsiae]
MSYPGPPGVANNAAGSHPSLPPRPPQSQAGSSGFKSTFSAAPAAYPSTSSYSSAPSYSTAPVSAPQYGASTTAYPSYSAAPSVGARGYQQPAASYGAYPQNYGQQATYYGAASTGAYGTPPQIRNPFPAPGAAVAAAANPFDRHDPNYDPEMAAQIAQWQSAYLPKEASADANGTGAGSKTAGGSSTTGAPTATKYGVSAGPTYNAEAAAKAAAAEATSASSAQEKKKTVYREGGGKKWADDSLLEWDPSHLRLFVGNLAGETVDESLLKAFSKWKSVQKAKVVRDKRTNKSKGFGFVSFSDPDDFFQAAKEMNGKYIQSHPVVVRKSTTEIRPASVRDDRHGRGKGHKDRNRKGGGGAGRGEGGGGYEPHLGPAGGGVVKPGQKTKDGLRILG